MKRVSESHPDYVSVAAELLGGEETLGVRVRARAELQSLAMSGGLRRSAAYALGDQFGDDVMFALLRPPSHQTISTFEDGAHARRSPHQELRPATANALVEGALVLAHAVDVFGTVEAARAWLLSPVPSLAGRAPLELIKLGQLKDVDDTLGRLEHGVYA